MMMPPTVMPGQESPVYRSINRKEELLVLYHVFGDYDFFLIMPAESLAKLNRLMEIIQDDPRIAAARTYW
jgi:DNA-binding Lrp family transcriptional regulator